MSKNKFIPKNNLNPAKQKLIYDNRIDKFDKALIALSKSFDIHISYLGNFARHDIKNSIQSMDSILSTNSQEEITNEHLESLKANLKVIRETLDNFSKLVPYSQDETFSLQDLLIAVELINRSSFHENKIAFEKDLLNNINDKFNLPFQSILQLLNNLIINAVNSFQNIDKPVIKLKIEIIKNNLLIEIFDNGNEIDLINMPKIFNFGYSTTGGSGIGLFHARYFCEQFNGTIELKSNENIGFTKSFLISLPINKD